MEGDETQQRVVLGEIPGLPMLSRQVAKSVQVERQIFISLFLPCLVRSGNVLWQRQHAWLAGCSGARAEGECQEGCDGAVLPAPTRGRKVWARLVKHAGSAC